MYQDKTQSAVGSGSFS